MRIPKILLVVMSILVFGLIIGGCTLFPTNKTRPAPVRPGKISFIRTPHRIPPSPSVTMRPGGRTRPAPIKRTKGLTSITERHIIDRLNRIETAAAQKNWSIANRETNTLGLEMGRFRPTASKGRSLREIASFNTIYVKLQADCKLRNRTAAIQDTRRLKSALSHLRRTA